jgi:Cdc6-like AAA superfamily ATPase
MFMEMPEGFDKFLHAKYEKEREAILNLITPFNYATKQSEYLKSRHLETCQWFVDSIEYRGWLNADGDKRTLFCPGMPGSGKTVLASIVVDDLCHRFRNDTTIGVAYIFCNFQRRSEQNPVELLASLLKQLSQKQSLLPECVRELYETHKENWTRPSLDEISSAIQSVTAGYTRVYIIVDALDECQTSNGCRMRFLREIFNLQAKYGAHFFATSRFIPDIAESFKGSTSLEVKAHEEDIRSYIDGSILNLPGFVRCNPTLQDIIKKGIVQAANGMYVIQVTGL